MKLISAFLLLLLTFSAQAKNTGSTNRLIHESSPYLLQHAHNPVDWYPWGDEAFNKARKENKPVFISIGYSTCHWCHVMAHESFESKAVADILNKDFISIKVDREERPDIDRIYLTATEIMAGYGGWPNTIIATPQLKPFFAATYMPPDSKDGHKGLKEILNQVVVLWKTDRSRINKVADEVTEMMRSHLTAKATKGKVKASSITKTYESLESRFDSEYGGFGNAPKFPRASTFDFLLQYQQKNPSSKSLEMVLTSLDHMIRGGIYDQIEGGFHRYSVDAQWQVPHFEKMLYDQGLIINTLIDTSTISNTDRYHATIKQSLSFLLNKMQNKDGGFYSAYDADSSRPDNPKEHGEGAYYVWNKKELDSILNKAEQNIFYTHFNILKDGNVISDPQKEFTNLNILHAENPINESAKLAGISKTKAATLIQSSIDKLKLKREKRPLPHLDDKIITSWNALAIKAFSKAAKLLNKPYYNDAAENSARFIYKNLYNPKTKHLYRSYRNGKHSGKAYLDDYAYLVNALISLYKSTEDRQWLIWASELTRQQIKLFYDTANGGFFDNTAEDKNILIRSKEIYDGSLPSANAISVENLILLSAIMKRPDWHVIAVKTVHSFHENMNELYDNYPQMFKSLLITEQ